MDSLCAMTTHSAERSNRLGSAEQQRVEDTFQHFKREFPSDPVGAFARFFAKSCCRQCSGRGLQTFIAADPALRVADLRLCACARRRLGRFVTKVLLFDTALERGGIAFAESTVCPGAELALPVVTASDAPRAT